MNPASESLFITSALTLRAFENTCAVIFVNAGCPTNESNSHYAGLSRVTLPFIGPVGDETKDSNKEGMSIVDIDMKLVEEAEKNYKVREDIAQGDWHYEYRHVRGHRSDDVLGNRIAKL